MRPVDWLLPTRQRENTGGGCQYGPMRELWWRSAIAFFTTATLTIIKRYPEGIELTNQFGGRISDKIQIEIEYCDNLPLMKKSSSTLFRNRKCPDSSPSVRYTTFKKEHTNRSNI